MIVSIVAADDFLGDFFFPPWLPGSTPPLYWGGLQFACRLL